MIISKVKWFGFVVMMLVCSCAQQASKVKLEYYNQRKFIAPEDGCAVISFGQIAYHED